MRTHTDTLTHTHTHTHIDAHGGTRSQHSHDALAKRSDTHISTRNVVGPDRHVAIDFQYGEACVKGNDH